MSIVAVLLIICVLVGAVIHYGFSQSRMVLDMALIVAMIFLLLHLIPL